MPSGECPGVCSTSRRRPPRSRTSPSRSSRVGRTASIRQSARSGTGRTSTRESVRKNPPVSRSRNSSYRFRRPCARCAYASNENEPDVKKVIDTARGVEGLVRQMGVHAAGVI
ncbi:hypothetical protein ABZ372_40580, partial [Streptomyces sp. NPDC005921]